MFSDISARAQENFSGVRLIRAYVQEDAEIRIFEASNQEYIRRSLKLVRLMGMLWPTLEIMLGLAVVLVLWLGGSEVLSGPHPRRRFRLLQHLHDPTHLAHHRAGLGHQHCSSAEPRPSSASTKSCSKSPRSKIHPPPKAASTTAKSPAK